MYYWGSVRNYLGEGHYLCREGHNFFEQRLGTVTIFLPKLKEGHNFLIAKPADPNICPSNYPPATVTGPSREFK